MAFNTNMLWSSLGCFFMLDRGPNTTQVKGRPLLVNYYLCSLLLFLGMCWEAFKHTKIQKNQNHLEINFWTIPKSKVQLTLVYT
jgi:hypothetical protein